jgi:hypothetical protein
MELMPMSLNQDDPVVFDIADVLSIVTGKSFWRDDLEGLDRLIRHLTGGQESTFSPNLPRVRLACKAEILQQHPELRRVHIDPGTADRLANDETFASSWRHQQECNYGSKINLIPATKFRYSLNARSVRLRDGFNRAKAAVFSNFGEPIKPEGSPSAAPISKATPRSPS